MELKYDSWKLKFCQNKGQIFYFENAETGSEVLLRFTVYIIFTYVEI